MASADGVQKSENVIQNTLYAICFQSDVAQICTLKASGPCGVVLGRTPHCQHASAAGVGVVFDKVLSQCFEAAISTRYANGSQ